MENQSQKYGANGWIGRKVGEDQMEKNRGRALKTRYGTKLERYPRASVYWLVRASATSVL